MKEERGNLFATHCYPFKSFPSTDAVWWTRPCYGLQSHIYFRFSQSTDVNHAEGIASQPAREMCLCVCRYWDGNSGVYNTRQGVRKSIAKSIIHTHTYTHSKWETDQVRTFGPAIAHSMWAGPSSSLSYQSTSPTTSFLYFPSFFPPAWSNTVMKMESIAARVADLFSSSSFFVNQAVDSIRSPSQ